MNSLGGFFSPVSFKEQVEKNILNSKVNISLKRDKEIKHGVTVQKVLETFLSFLDADEIYFTGSALRNCLIPGLIPESDIDVKMVLQVEKNEDKVEYFKRVHDAWIRTFESLLGRHIDNLSDLGLKSLSPTFNRNGDEAFAEFSLQGEGRDRPLEFSLRVLSDETIPTYITNADSLRLSVKDLLGDKYTLSSAEGDIESVLRDLSEKKITSNVLDKVQFGWARYLDLILQGFYSFISPAHEERLAFTCTPLEIGRLLKKRGGEPLYSLLFSIQNIFHASDARKETELLSLLASYRGGDDWPYVLRSIYEQHPHSDKKSLLQLFMPLFAQEIHVKKHQGVNQLQCRFHNLYLMVPLLEKRNQEGIVDLVREGQIYGLAFLCQEQDIQEKVFAALKNGDETYAYTLVTLSTSLSEEEFLFALEKAELSLLREDEKELLEQKLVYFMKEGSLLAFVELLSHLFPQASCKTKLVCGSLRELVSFYKDEVQNISHETFRRLSKLCSLAAKVEPSLKKPWKKLLASFLEHSPLIKEGASRELLAFLAKVSYEEAAGEDHDYQLKTAILRNDPVQVAYLLTEEDKSYREEPVFREALRILVKEGQIVKALRLASLSSPIFYAELFSLALNKKEALKQLKEDLYSVSDVFSVYEAFHKTPEALFLIEKEFLAQKEEALASLKAQKILAGRIYEHSQEERVILVCSLIRFLSLENGVEALADLFLQVSNEDKKAKMVAYVTHYLSFLILPTFHSLLARKEALKAHQFLQYTLQNAFDEEVFKEGYRQFFLQKHELAKKGEAVKVGAFYIEDLSFEERFRLCLECLNHPYLRPLLLLAVPPEEEVLCTLMQNYPDWTDATLLEWFRLLNQENRVGNAQKAIILTKLADYPKAMSFFACIKDSLDEPLFNHLRQEIHKRLDTLDVSRKQDLVEFLQFLSSDPSYLSGFFKEFIELLSLYASSKGKKSLESFKKPLQNYLDIHQYLTKESMFRLVDLSSHFSLPLNLTGVVKRQLEENFSTYTDELVKEICKQNPNLSLLYLQHLEENWDQMEQSKAISAFKTHIQYLSSAVPQKGDYQVLRKMLPIFCRRFVEGSEQITNPIKVSRILQKIILDLRDNQVINVREYLECLNDLVFNYHLKKISESIETSHFEEIEFHIDAYCLYLTYNVLSRDSFEELPFLDFSLLISFLLEAGLSLPQLEVIMDKILKTTEVICRPGYENRCTYQIGEIIVRSILKGHLDLVANKNFLSNDFIYKLLDFISSNPSMDGERSRLLMTLITRLKTSKSRISSSVASKHDFMQLERKIMAKLYSFWRTHQPIRPLKENEQILQKETDQLYDVVTLCQALSFIYSDQFLGDKNLHDFNLIELFEHIIRCELIYVITAVEYLKINFSVDKKLLNILMGKIQEETQEKKYLSEVLKILERYLNE